MTALKFIAPATLPPGKYSATLVNIAEGMGKFGDYLDWEFEVTDPDGDTKPINRRTSTKTGVGAIARVFVESLLGRSVWIDEEVELNSLIDQTCELEIEPNANGYDHIVNAMPIVPGGTVTADDIAF